MNAILRHLDRTSWWAVGAIAASVFLVVLFTPHAYATEGTCSWHGGVNCSAGADWDGSAVCDDGWRDSSEIYSQVQMCNSRTTSSPVCTSEEASQLQIKYGISTLMAQSQTLSKQLESLSNSSLLTTDATTLRNNAIATLKLSSDISILNGQLMTAENKVTSECISLGLQEDQQRRSQELQTLHDAQYRCPGNSVISDDNKCVCPGGTVWNAGSCITDVRFQTPQTKPADTYAGYTNDDRCVKLNLGQFYNTDKQSCDSCPVGTTRITGTNSCQKPILIPTQQKVVNMPEKDVSTQATSSVVTNEQIPNLASSTTSPDVENRPISKPSSLWQKVTNPLKSIWGWIFK